MESNASTGVTHTIAFSLTGAGPFTIAPNSALPEITHPVIIDGLTQPGADCDDWPPTLLIELDGTNVPAILFPSTPPIGLSLAAGNSVVRGLVINRFLDNVVPSPARYSVRPVLWQRQRFVGLSNQTDLDRPFHRDGFGIGV